MKLTVITAKFWEVLPACTVSGDEIVTVLGHCKQALLVRKRSFPQQQPFNCVHMNFLFIIFHQCLQQLQ